VSRGIKILVAVIAAVAVLLGLNAIAVSNETKDAERNIEGAELVDTSSGTLQVLQEGTAGPPVVLIHGFAGSLRWYDQVAGLLSPSHRVIRVDLLGHGGSDKPSAGYSITDQANALSEALAKLGIKGATVVGHSLGGTVATALAEQSPDLASKVVIVDQAPDDSFEEGLGFAAQLGELPVIGQAMQRLTDVAPTSMVRDQYDRAFAPDFNIASGFENPDQVVDDLREMTYTAFIEIQEAESDYSDARPLNERLSAAEVPVLVIFGSEDQLYDVEESVAPFEGITGVQVQILEGSGHSPQVESPEEVASLIASFAATALPGEGEQRKPKPAPKKKGTGKNDDSASKKQGDDDGTPEKTDTVKDGK
jgi:pimeloyl-ACP methyl ester carboxylesterase